MVGSMNDLSFTIQPEDVTMTFPLQTEEIEIPIVDLEAFFQGRMTTETCRAMFESFCHTGVLYVRDPCTRDADSAAFLDAMEQIWSLPPEQLAALDGREHDYQIGLTPAGAEQPLDHSMWTSTLPTHHRPLTTPGVPDPKQRMMWPMGRRPIESRWPTIDVELWRPSPFIPFVEPLDKWGNTLLTAGKAFMEVMSRGAGSTETTISGHMNEAPHILGPTGSKLEEVPVGTVLAGLHYDFNLITVHGRSRYPILICWTIDGTPFVASPPEGCLLIQAGKMWEYLTGGRGYYGRHEVVMTPQGAQVLTEAIAAGRSTWRTSSNLFVHMNTSFLLQPLPQFRTQVSSRRFPPIHVGDYELAELAAIGLASEDRLSPDATTHLARIRANA